MTITIRLSKSEEERLAALAERTGRTKSFYVRAALREYLEDLEDAYDGDLAWHRFLASGEKARPIEDLIAELGFTEEELAQAEAELRASGDL